jgi:hypothetical protein
MVDIFLPGHVLPIWRPISLSRFLRGVALTLVLFLLLLGNWSAVITGDNVQRCKQTGAFSSGFGPGFDTQHCR